MPQPKKGPRLASGPKHQKAMLSNLAVALFNHERIETTEAKAKMLRPYAERLITKAKKGSVHQRRQVLSLMQDRDTVHKLFSDIGPRFADRNGGYTRILKIGPRNGDGAMMCLIELVEEGTVTRVAEEGGEETAATGGRRRLRRPARRKGTPEDKPTQSQAAEAATAGTPGEPGEVESPEAVADETAEAAQAAEDQALEDSSVEEVPAPGVQQGPEIGAGGVPEGGLPEDKSDTK